MRHIGDQVDFKWNGRWHSGAKLTGIYPEFRDAMKVEHSGLEYIIEGRDVMSGPERLAMVERVRVEKYRAEFQKEIDAWDRGAKTIKEMAFAMQYSTTTAANRIRAAKRRGLLA
jgi:hypothetical protein